MWNQVLTAQPLLPGTYIEFLVENLPPPSFHQWGLCIGLGPSNPILFGDDAIPGIGRFSSPSKYEGLPPHKGRSYAAHSGDLLPYYTIKFTKRVPYGKGKRRRQNK